MNVLIAFAGDMNGSGGMQKACITLANGLHQRGHEVAIGYGDTSAGDPFFPLSEGVRMEPFTQFAGKKVLGTLGHQISGWDKMKRELIRPFSRRKAREQNQKSKAHVIEAGIQAAIRETRPDVILSFGPDTSYYLFSAGCRVPVITLFRIEPRYVLSIAPEQEIDAVRRSSLVQVQLPFFAEQVEAWCGNVRTFTIPNPVKQVAAAADTSKKEKLIVHVARIDKRQKRQHILLEAFARTSDQFPDWNLEFWGNETSHAAYTKELRDRIQELHLEQRVKIKGATRNIEEVYERAAIFGFPSAFEGFPNALAEAMAHGIPAVGMADCPSSKALITDNKNGRLAADEGELADQLMELMGDENKRETLGTAARESMKAYAPEVIWDKWEEAMRLAMQQD
jgi:glycosyltransferase involved in cell wall biosynthesis